MNIVSVSCEVFPYSKTGGLADIVGALPKEWAELGHACTVITPLHRCIEVHKHDLKRLHGSISVRMGFWEEYADLWVAEFENTNLRVIFVDNKDYFDRESIYGRPDGFADNDRRFLFLSRAALSVCESLGLAPDVFIANDYHTAFSIVHLKRDYATNFLFERTLAVFSIHNLAFQGVYPFGVTQEIAGLLPQEAIPPSAFEFYGNVNFMKAGIEFADLVVTVSPSYAEEIQTTAFGNGLEGVLSQHSSKLYGILNGVDYNVWNPAFDEALPYKYDIEHLDGKAKTKRVFMQEIGLRDPSAPLLGLVSRLTDQKGIDLMQAVLDRVLETTSVNIAMQGSGFPEFEEYFLKLAERWPGCVYVHIGYNNRIAHLIEAAADIYLMPSRFEPCGLNQLYSMKYGTIPIVNPTGGLKDTIQDIDDHCTKGTGIVMQELSADELERCIYRAIELMNDRQCWRATMRRAMKRDFSSTLSARAYESLFKQALSHR